MPSLNEYFEAEVTEDVAPEETPAEVVEPEIEGEASGEPVEVEESPDPSESLADATEPGEPDAPDDEAPADVEEKPADPPADDEPDELVELTKRGWPKPPYKPEDLEKDPLAKSVHDHWHRVHSMSRREEKEWRKQYDGIDPEEAKQHKAVYEDITQNEKYESLRAIVGMSEHPAGEEARQFSNILADKKHPDHLRALRTWQQIRAGAPSPTQSEPAPQPQGVEQFTDEYGGIDEQKFAAFMQQRDRQIAERIVSTLKQQQAQTSSAAPPHPEPKTGDVVQQFAEFQGLNASEIRPLLLRQLHQRRADGLPDPDDSIQGVKMLWDAVVAKRENDVRAERQAETARLKSVSTSKPREAVPDTDTPVKGSTLYEFSERETGS